MALGTPQPPLSGMLSPYRSFRLAWSGLPSSNYVRSGVSFGPEGVFTGVDVLPPVNKVEDGEGYGANGTEFTGTLAPGGGSQAHGYAY